MAATATVVWVWAVRIPGPWNGLGQHPVEVALFRDDAYYEFAWARSVWSGDGPRVGAGPPTSGIQWLWSALLVPFGGSPAAAYLLGLASLVGTACLTGIAFLRSHAHWPTAVTASCCVAGCPFLVTEAQNGQETGMAILAAVALVLAHTGSTPASVATRAAVSVLATLARTDLWLLVCALELFGIGKGRLLRPIAVCTLSLGCHLGLQWALTGRLTQDSAWPIPWLFWQAFLQQDPGTAEWISRLWFFGRPCAFGGPFAHGGCGAAVGVALAWVVAPWYPATQPLRRTTPIVLVAAAWTVGVDDLLVPAWAAAVYLIVDTPTEADRASWHPRLAAALCTGFIAVVAAHFVVRGYPRDYYFAPLAAAAITTALVVARGQTVVLALLIAGNIGSSLVDTPKLRPWQAEMRLAGEHLGQVLPAGTAIGCFNSGIVTWFATDHRIVNLDGVVNRGAFDALQARDLRGYCRRHGIAYLLDTEDSFARENSVWPHCSGQYFGPTFDPARDLVEIARFDVLGADAGREGSDGFRLYRFADEPGVGYTAPRGLRRFGPRTVRWTSRGGDELVGETGATTLPEGLTILAEVPATVTDSTWTLAGHPVVEPGR